MKEKKNDTRKSERRMERIRPLLFLLTALIAGSVLAYGIFREEIGEVMFNAAML
jgi:hypothetical protein